VSITGRDGVRHSVELTAGSLFEAASAALAGFRQHRWAVDALTPNAVVRVEVQLPPTVHEVPLKAIEQWQQSPTTSPKDYIVKRVR